MLTTLTPALNRALSPVFDQGQLAQFMAGAGMCSVPLEHRAPTTYSNGQNGLDGRNGHDGRDGPGGAPGRGWDPKDYPDLFPSTTNNTFVDITNNSNYRAGDWFQNYYAGPNQDFRTILNQTMNQYMSENHYAGDTINIAGNTNTTNLTTNTVNTENINTTNINNFPTAPGPSGPQGDRGLDGRPGALGQAGAPGRDGAIVVVGNQFDPTDILKRLERLEQKVESIVQACKRATGETDLFAVVDGFDPDECDVTFGNSPRVKVNINIPV